jgi:hypothetical protein
MVSTTLGSLHAGAQNVVTADMTTAIKAKHFNSILIRTFGARPTGFI